MKTRSLFVGVAILAIAVFAFAGGPPRGSDSAPSLAADQRQNATLSAQNANLSSGTPTAGSTVACALGGVLNSLSVGVQGTYSATLIVQVTADNANWVTVPSSAYSKVSDGTTGALGGAGMWTVSVSGLSARVTCSAYTSGSAAVSLVPYSAAGGGGSVSALQSGAWTVQPGNTANTTPWLVSLSGTNSTVPVTGAFWQTTQPVSPALTTSGGVASNYANGALSNSPVTVKSSAGNLYDYHISNPNTSGSVCIEFFNAASGSVTLGTTVPLWHATLQAGHDANFAFAVPHSFGTAISIVAVTAYNGSTAPTTAVDVSVGYN